MSYFKNTQSQTLIETISLTNQWQGKHAYNVNILGRRTNTFLNTTDLNDVCEFLASGETVYTKPAPADTFVVNSTSTNDTSAGTGARSVEIYYLDASGNELDVEVTLNGTSDVAVAALTNCTFIQYMYVKTKGTLPTADGTITLYNTAKTIKYEQITAGGNQSLSARYMIPTGYTGYISSWNGGAIRQAQDIRLRATTDKGDRTQTVPGFLFQDTQFMGADTSFSVSEPFLSFPAGSEVKVSSIAQATTGNPRIDTSFPLTLIAN